MDADAYRMIDLVDHEPTGEVIYESEACAPVWREMRILGDLHEEYFETLYAMTDPDDAAHEWAEAIQIVLHQQMQEVCAQIQVAFHRRRTHEPN